MRHRYQLIFLCLAFCAPGVGEELLAHQGGTAIPVNTWTTFETHGFPVQDAGYSKFVYCANLRSICGVGLYRQPWTEYDASIRAWNYDTNYWSILAYGGNYHEADGWDAGHSVGFMDYMPIRNTIVTLAGYSGTNEPENINHTWWFDTVGLGTQDHFTRPNPVGNIEMSGGMVYDQAHDVIVMCCPETSGHTWHYAPATNVWTDTGVSGPGVSVQAMAYDTLNHLVYFFGGGTGSLTCPGETVNNNMWTYDSQSETWTKLTVSGTVPSARFRPAMAYSTADNLFVMTGGVNCGSDSTFTVLTDTYTFNPVTNVWTQLSAGANGLLSSDSGAYERLTYDPDHNAFIFAIESSGTQYLDGTWTTLPVSINVLCLSQCGNVGTQTASYSPPVGSISHYTTGPQGQSISHETSIAATGNTLYEVHTETDGTWYDATNGPWDHPYVQSNTNGAGWMSLGNGYGAILSDSDCNNALDWGGMPSVASVNGTAWVTYWEGCLFQKGPLDVAKQWNGSAWTGGTIGLRTAQASGIYQANSRIVAVGTTPYMIFREIDKRVALSQVAHCYVDLWNGSAWTAAGNALNVNANSIDSSCEMTSDGTHPWAVITEYVEPSFEGTPTITPQVYVLEYVNGAWTQIGGSLNQTTSDYSSWASITFLAGQPYVAWTERTIAGKDQVFVKTWNGSAWSLVGSGPLNRNNSTGWAWYPQIANDGASLYVLWTEQQNLNQVAQTYLAKWNGSGWAFQGGSANMDTSYGASSHASLALAGTTPAIVWSETLLGSQAQAYAKEWNGTDWIALGAPSAITTGGPGLSGSIKIGGKVIKR